MDVMSMLNSSAEAAEQPQVVEKGKGSSRNRTPWDAGGYSLPFHSHEDSFSHDTGVNRSPAPSPIDQVNHKLSNSHSSVSSFASSDSASHSRFSSSSTTVSNSYQAHHASNHGIFPLAETDARQCRSGPGGASPASPFSGRSTCYTASPSEQFSDLALGPEGRLAELPWPESLGQTSMNAERSMARSTARTKRGKENRPSNYPPRPASPSDAILIKRTTSSLSPPAPERFDLVVTESLQSHQAPTSGGGTFTLSDTQTGRLSLPMAAHKRAVSAPDFSAAEEHTISDHQRPSNMVSSSAALTPPSSESPERSSPDATTSPRAMAASAEPSSPSQDGEPCCMYMPNCTTGSALRKAVSHIFGRNKMATRRIPKHVWVWYCRKHYQRARYRNSLEWAKTLQYDLVTQQVKRLQNWSNFNRTTSRGDVVTSYRLAVRKREQRRLDAKKPRGEREFSDCEDDGELGEHSNTAVPKWLLDLCGRDHDFRTILEVVVNGIRDDLASGTLSAWPDIEILPNIVLDEDEPESPKGYTKRRPSAVTHRRSQSLSTALLSDDHSSNQFTAQPTTWPDHRPSLHGGMAHKRKRYDDLEEEEEEEENMMVKMNQQAQRFRVSEPPGPERRLDQFGLSPLPHNMPLPHPRRGVSHLTGPYMDGGIPISETSYARSRRGAHKRSQSDMTTFHPLQPSFQGTAGTRGSTPVLQQHGGHAPRHLLSPPALSPPTFRQETLRHEATNHNRHQSTPTVPPITLPLSLGSSREPYRMQQGTLPSPPIPRHHTLESTQATSVYAARR